MRTRYCTLRKINDYARRQSADGTSAVKVLHENVERMEDCVHDVVVTDE